LGGRRPAAGPLAVRLKPRQRYPTAGRPLGTRTLRRHGSYRPRGGIHPHPRSRMKRSRGPATEPPGPDFNVFSRRVGGSIARRVGGPSLVFHSVGVLFCPAGYERSLGLHIERSPPTRLRVRSRLGRETSRGRAPRCSPETAPASPHRGTPARSPHAPAPWLVSPAGRISPPPSRSLWPCLRGVSSVLGWAERFRLAGGAAIAPEATGSQACGSGVGCR
jgi:hypothetical protein